MTIAFIYPQILWLLCLLPLTILLALLGPRRPTKFRFWSGLALRSLLLLLIIFALAGIQLRLPNDSLTTVFLLDVSDSIPTTEQSRGEGLIRQAVTNMPVGDQAAVVLFGQEALVERLASSDQQLADLTSIPIRARTDIASALQLGLALFPDSGARRLVLLSDGQENLGQALAQAEIAAASDIEISFFPLSSPQSDVEVRVDGLDAPANTREGQGFDLTARIHSSNVTQAVLRIFADGTLFHSKEITLQSGMNRFQIPVEANEGGFHRFQAQVVPQTDQWLQNNQASAFTVVHGPPRILLLEGTPGEGQHLSRALSANQLVLTTRSAYNLPTTLAELAAYDAIILVNVSASSLPASSQETLQAYVRDLGKGLLMTGGENSFGAGGYLRTPLEEALPVAMDVRSKEQSPNLALALVVDKSGSMGACHCDDPNKPDDYTQQQSGQPKVDIAKEAIMEAADALGDADQMGVVAFDDNAEWTVSLEPLLNFVDLEQSIGTIQANGPTNVEIGMTTAYEGLQGIEARRKHVILLTDGWGREGDITTLVEQMNEQDITLSVVAAGGGSATYLASLAQKGGGNFYPAADILQVPDFFLKETIKAVGRYIVEEPFYPLPFGTSSILRGLDLGAMPILWGYNGTTPKQTARVVMSTPQGDPLLMTWQYGLGRSAVWTSDVTGRWATEWVAWDEFARFASQLVRWTLTAPRLQGITAQTQLENGEAILQVGAADEQGQPRNFLSLEATLIGPDLQTQEITLEQVGAGQYEARTPLNESGTWLVQLHDDGETTEGVPNPAQQTLGLVVPYSPEYKNSSLNRSLLQMLADRTGGSELLNPVNAFLHNLPAADQAREIWRALLLTVALLFPLDVALRRVLWGSQPLQNLQSALPWRREESSAEGTSSSPERALGSLLDARARVQQRHARRGEQAEDSPNAKDADTTEDDLQSSSTENDTMARLRQAKKRARGK